jgi:alpha-tubulin suppressor-like RCC1 family protein
LEFAYDLQKGDVLDIFVGGAATFELPDANMQFLKVACGDAHTMFIRGDDSLWGVGFNSSGQLGDGTLVTKHIPVKILDNVADVVCGSDFTLILLKTGELRACGANHNSQIGDGFTTARQQPVRVMENVRKIAAGHQHSLAIDKAIGYGHGV